EPHATVVPAHREPLAVLRWHARDRANEPVVPRIRRQRSVGTEHTSSPIFTARGDATFAQGGERVNLALVSVDHTDLREGSNRIAHDASVSEARGDGARGERRERMSRTVPRAHACPTLARASIPQADGAIL